MSAPKEATVPPREPRKPNYHKFMPLLYAPLLPLVRIGLNGRVKPATRDKIFMGTVLFALAHAGYMMSGDSSMTAGG
eukprot:jgi/Botrbrau1/2672/Bobra.0203s0018.1